jgi:N-acetylglucosamine kinase-like BadF-type ATPase
MFIIAESGSTKTDWVVIDDKGNVSDYHSAGMNPAVMREFPDLSECQGLLSGFQMAESIFFYGAGVSDQSAKKKLETFFRSNGFSGRLFAEGDMLAAARALCGNEAGIACILGTGSNSCVYDGNRITSKIPSLGYIIGDEGGGVHFGKEILRSYFYRTMPEDVHLAFENKYHLNLEDLITNVYQGEAPNRYIASFTEFIVEINSPWKTALAEKVLNEFVVSRILCFKENKSLKVHFAGSIAYHFREYLLRILNKYGLNPGNIVVKPVDLLVRYHLNNKIYE